MEEKKPEDYIKILELVCSKIYPEQKNEDVVDLVLKEEDFIKEGYTFNSGYLILKQLQDDKWLSIDHVLLDTDDSDIDFMQKRVSVVTSPFIQQYVRDLKYQSSNTLKLNDLYFDKEKSILVLNGKEVKISLKNEKINAHYVLEYMFENDPKEKAYYSEIIEEKFLNEKIDWRAIYRACNDIQEKVRNQASITDFLIIKTGITGYVQLNTNYL